MRSEPSSCEVIFSEGKLSLVVDTCSDALGTMSGVVSGADVCPAPCSLSCPFTGAGNCEGACASAWEPCFEIPVVFEASGRIDSTTDAVTAGHHSPRVAIRNPKHKPPATIAE